MTAGAAPVREDMIAQLVLWIEHLPLGDLDSDAATALFQERFPDATTAEFREAQIVHTEWKIAKFDEKLQ